MVFGRISEETPEYDQVGEPFGANDLTLRVYKPQTLASVSSESFPDVKTTKEFQSKAFRTLASYIGVLSKPNNKGSQSIAMTAPVTMTTTENDLNTNNTTAAAPQKKGESIAMTAPVVMSAGDKNSINQNSVNWNMSFILPSKFIKTGEEPPEPLDERVKISTIEERTLVVKTYSGSSTRTRAEKIAIEVVQEIKKDGKGIEIVLNSDGEPVWEYMGYNPPFTLPWFRTNEVAVAVTQTTST